MTDSCHDIIKWIFNTTSWYRRKKSFLFFKREEKYCQVKQRVRRWWVVQRDVLSKVKGSRRSCRVSKETKLAYAKSVSTETHWNRSTKETSKEHFSVFLTSLFMRWRLCPTYDTWPLRDTAAKLYRHWHNSLFLQSIKANHRILA
jgi:hypothetical protein